MAGRATAFQRQFGDPPSVALVRKVLIALVVIHIPLALWSGYRAIVQVQKLELSTPTRTLAAGSPIHVSVVSSGRASVDVVLEMIQGTHAETLGVRHVPAGRSPAYDPRFRRGAMSVLATPELLARFAPGAVVVRATAHGRSQWLRTPPPEVREVAVQIGPQR